MATCLAISKKQFKLLAALTAASLLGSACAAEDLSGVEPDEPGTENPADKAGTPGPRLGGHYSALGDRVDFRVYSSRATRIELHVFRAATGQAEAASYVMTKDPATNQWTKSLTTAELSALGITGHVYYGYRAWGPNWPYQAGWSKGSTLGFISDVDAQGNRFNPNKLLSDPYSLEISHDPANPQNPDDSNYASGPSFRHIDNALVATKSIAFPKNTTSFGTKPTRAFKDDIVYEVHVRGLTMQDTSIPAQYRGTYKGAGLKAAALAQLGVTAVEFLPIHETVNDVNDFTVNSTAGDNYWGYMTVNFFAPDRRYSSDKTPGGPTREFKEMVKAFHDQQIKVYVDVVYNHTAEGGPFSPSDPRTAKLYNFRGLDNPTYYSLTSDMQFNYDNTGVGGNFNTFNPITQNLIIDSLLYWRDEMGLDGYRFDLATVLGNTCQHGCFNYDKLNPGTALNRIWNDLSPRPANGGAGVDLIAEPWAIGGNSYQVGNLPSGWMEWGASFRDSLRKDQNKLGTESVTPGELATRFSGSSDKFGDDGRKPWHSVNFMVAHDGFTLKDLYSCNNKSNNQPWPFGPSDGGEDHNNSWDQGGVAAQQRRASRNGMAFMLLSAGVPMFNGGDEFLRSQNCNNNAYNLDSPANWLNYSLSTDQQNFRTFTQRLIAFRKAHPSLRPSNFYSAVDNNGNVMEQLRWFKPDGAQADATYFNNASNHAIAYRIDGTELGDTAKAIYVAYNGWQDMVNFKLPWTGQQAANWYRVVDTCDFAEGANQVRLPGSEDLIGPENTNYGLCGRGFLVLIAK